jgi:hypothetical protein
VCFFIREMWLQNVQVLNLAKLHYSLSGLNLHSALSTDNEKHLDDPTEGGIILKCTLIITVQDLNYIPYIRECKDMKGLNPIKT